MAVENIYWKIVKYLEANSKTDSEFSSGNVKLQNDSDGNGDYIKVWTVDGLDKPTDSQLDALASNATTEQNNYKIGKTRRRAYGDIGDQLDLLYKDMVAGKLDTTGDWATKIKAVKDANPKE